ncbi:MAG: TRAP transporter substrate-binding protein, partial [Synergistaceae bacterium]|nr:TRAP transporter substrate-binding protein [Synergistaceae bacterium]
MKKLKLAAFLAFAALTALGLLHPAASLAADKIDVKIQAPNNPKSVPDQPIVVATQKFAEELEKRAGDKVTVRLFWDDQLAKTYEGAINLVQNNDLQIAMMSLSSFSGFSKAGLPLSNLFLIPYPHTELAYRIIDGNVGEIIRKKAIEDTGIRIVSFWDVGFRHLLTVKKPITGIDSIKGLKFRVQPNPIHISAFKLLETNPTPISFGELFTSLQQGVIDGTENPLENVMAARLYEVCSELALTGHLYEFFLVYANESWYQNLPEDVRTAWDESAKAATQAYREQLSKKNDEWTNFFKENGLKISALQDSELEKFRDAVKPSREEAIKQVGADYHESVI